MKHRKQNPENEKPMEKKQKNPLEGSLIVSSANLSIADSAPPGWFQAPPNSRPHLSEPNAVGA